MQTAGPLLVKCRRSCHFRLGPLAHLDGYVLHITSNYYPAVHVCLEKDSRTGPENMKAAAPADWTSQQHSEGQTSADPPNGPHSWGTIAFSSLKTWNCTFMLTMFFCMDKSDGRRYIHIKVHLTKHLAFLCAFQKIWLKRTRTID